MDLEMEFGDKWSNTDMKYLKIMRMAESASSNKSESLTIFSLAV